MKSVKMYLGAALALCIVAGIVAFTPAAKKGKWETLFNGKNFDGWKKWKGGEITGWKVEDGAMVLVDKKGGDLLTNKEYGDFELELEWKISEAGNSGIMYHVKEGADYCCPYTTGPEIQVLDDAKHPDSFAGKVGNHKAGSLYDLLPPTDMTVVKPAGEWNKARIVIQNGKGESWLNGKKVVEYELHSDEWNKHKMAEKFKDVASYGAANNGYITFQNHGSEAWFKNIKIKEL